MYIVKAEFDGKVEYFSNNSLLDPKLQHVMDIEKARIAKRITGVLPSTRFLLCRLNLWR